ncbi:putative Endochitinase EP3 [Hypsibius exemplaris]|uniref:Endochitinase EP3 n=1 Tax=Hypsibius exemplaris TaxID=2072580 RepID=A0A1W0WIJ6_HYPEX|nr:putative Endochitinase EP3 [Hypsibius exemplaris]
MKNLASLVFFACACHLTAGCQSQGEGCAAHIACCSGHHCKIVSSPWGFCERGGSSAGGSARQPATRKPGSPQSGGGLGHGSRPSSGNGSISKSEFNQAFTSSGFVAPPTAYYHAFVSPSVKRLGGITSKREFAMFLANVIHETSGLKYLEELEGPKHCTNGKYREVWGARPARFHMNKCYHGRGPIQLSHPQNYHDASLAIFGNAATLIDHPERVLTDKQTSWDTAAWYWGSRVGNQPGVKQGKFGASINAINGPLECRGQNQEKVTKRKEYYTNIYRVWRLSGSVDLSGC